MAEISAIDRGEKPLPPDYIDEFVAWLALDAAAALNLEGLASGEGVGEPQAASLSRPATDEYAGRLSDAAIRAKALETRNSLAVAEPDTQVWLVWACEHGILGQFEDYELHVESDAQMGSAEAYIATSPLRMVVGENTYLQAFRNAGRHRFTLAHELGHLVLHLPWLNVPDAAAARPTQGLSYQSRFEHQANKFAAEFLLPESVVRSAPDPDTLSKMCGVSKLAAEIRMRELHVWPKPNPLVVEGFRRLLAQLKNEAGLTSQNPPKVAVRQEAWGKLIYNFDKDEFSAQVLAGHEPVPKAPIGIGWVILGGCNEECGICYGNVEQLPRGRLKLKDALRVANILKDADIMRVVISGGEPLMYPGIFDVIDALAENGISVVLGTNGTFLSSMNAYRATKCTRVEISLDAANQELNNTLRPSRMPGGNSWKESIAAIKSCLAANIPVRVLTTITRLNQHQLLALGELLDQIGVTDWALSWVLPAGRAAPNYEQLRPDEAVIQQQLRQVRKYCSRIQLRYSSRSPTQYDRFYFLILPDGQIATEDMSRGQKVTFGSVLDVPILSTWTNENFAIGAHFQKWVAGRVAPLA